MTIKTPFQTRKWVQEQLADAVINRAARLLANLENDATDIREIHNQRDRLLKTLRQFDKIPPRGSVLGSRRT